MPNVSAFLSYVLLNVFTPGPNNIMAMSNAGRHGFRGGLRFCIGAFLGFFSVMTVCTVFSALLYTIMPKIEPIMVWVGAAYILWLAWVIWRDKPHTEKRGGLEINSVLTGMALQFVNPKVILCCITTMSTFVLPHYKAPHILALFALGISLSSLCSCLCWALFGSVFHAAFTRHRKAVNLVLALLLVFCAFSLLLGR